MKIMAYYCKGKDCENNSMSAPFENDLCDTCWGRAKVKEFTNDELLGEFAQQQEKLDELEVPLPLVNYFEELVRELTLREK